VTKRVLPAVRASIKVGYFSLAVEGAERVPREGPVVFVANHSGWFTVDSFFFALAVADHVGVDRFPYGATHDSMLALPWLGSFLERMGGFPATWLREPSLIPKEMQRFLVYPEGAAGNTKPFWKAYRMQAWRSGFARLALERRAMVVPVAIVGGEEVMPVVCALRCLESRVHAAIPVPVVPWPLPARWKVVFHDPVAVRDLEVDTGDPAEAARRRHELIARVRSTVQRTLDHETQSHRLTRWSRFFARGLTRARVALTDDR